MDNERNPEELAQYLDELFRSSKAPSPDEVDDPLARTALRLAQDEQPKLSVDARARMLEKVQQAHTSASRTPPKQPIAFPVQSVLRWVAVFAVFIILLNNVALPAMADSVPGDLLYPVKQTIEAVELGLANSDASRADVFVRQAERRLDEANRLLSSGKVNETLVLQAITNLNRAQELEPDNTTVADKINAHTVYADDLIDRIAETDQTTANNLNQQLLKVLPPTAEPTSTPSASQETVVLQPTATDTASPTATFSSTPTPSPTATATFTPTATDTLEPSLTHIDEPTATWTPEPSPTYTPTYEIYTGVVSATAVVNVRELPSTDSKVLQQVEPGTIVTVLSETLDGSWLQVELETGLQGWIASTLVVEGTVPQFTIATETEEIEPASVTGNTDPASIIPDDGSTDNSNGNTSDSSSTNQGNDGINKFDCDGRGNSCNVGPSDDDDESDSSSSPDGGNDNNNSNNKDKNKNK